MYPHTTRLIRILAADNVGLDTNDQLKGMDDWVWPENIDQIEAEAVKLSLSEMKALARSGKQADKVYRKHGAYKLRDFIEEFAWGNLFDNFYNPSPGGSKLREAARMHPSLTKIITLLATDSDLRLKPKPKWVWPNNSQRLEDMASILDDDQIAIIITGEFTQQQALITKYDLSELDDFINEVFDGDLTYNFCKGHKDE